MNANLRFSLYIVSVFVNAAIAVLVTQIELSIYILAGVAGLNAVVAIIAGKHVTPDEVVTGEE